MEVASESITVNFKDFDKICRTCCSSQDLQSINGLLNNSDLISIELILNIYTQVELDATDNLPQQICTNCVENLQNAYSFLNNCNLVNKALVECAAQCFNNLENKISEPRVENCIHSPPRYDIKKEEISDSIHSPDDSDTENVNHLEIASVKVENSYSLIDVKEEPVTEQEIICIDDLQETETDDRNFDNYDTSDTSTASRPKTKETSAASRKKRKCLVTGCRGPKRGGMVHHLPKREEKRNQWLQSIKRPDIINVSYTRSQAWGICHRHFAASAYRVQGGRRLNIQAEPTRKPAREVKSEPKTIAEPQPSTQLQPQAETPTASYSEPHPEPQKFLEDDILRRTTITYKRRLPDTINVHYRYKKHH